MHWTVEQEAIARRLLDSKAPEGDWLAFGRTKNAARTHFSYFDHHDERLQYQRRHRRSNYIASEMEAINSMVNTRGRPTEAMLAEAELRMTAARSITAWLMGDPPPGYSALDMKR